MKTILSGVMAIIALALAVLVGGAVSAPDKYTLKVPGSHFSSAPVLTRLLS